MFFDNNLRVTYLMHGEAVLWCGVEKVAHIRTTAIGALGQGVAKQVTITNPEIPLFSLTLTLSRVGLTDIEWVAIIESAQKETAMIRFTRRGFFRSESCVLIYQGIEVFKTGRSGLETWSNSHSKFNAIIESKPPFAHSAKILEINRDWSDTPSLCFGLTSDPLCNSFVLAFGLIYDHEHLTSDSV